MSNDAESRPTRDGKHSEVSKYRRHRFPVGAESAAEGEYPCTIDFKGTVGAGFGPLRASECAQEPRYRIVDESPHVHIRTGNLNQEASPEAFQAGLRRFVAVGERFLAQQACQWRRYPVANKTP